MLQSKHDLAHIFVFQILRFYLTNVRSTIKHISQKTKQKSENYQRIVDNDGFPPNWSGFSETKWSY